MMKLSKKKILNIIKEEIEDYKGAHSAPSKSDGNNPLYDLTGYYGEDIYGPKASRIFSSGCSYDAYVINIIDSCRNRPNKLVKIYRAVPNLNYDVDKKIKNLQNIVKYRNKFGFFPLKNNVVDFLQKENEKYFEEHGYDAFEEKINSDILGEIEKLSSNKNKKLKINDGDWVALDIRYAKQHGESNLNNKYKVLSKTVNAKNVYNEGNSIQEWGYVENV